MFSQIDRQKMEHSTSSSAELLQNRSRRCTLCALQNESECLHDDKEKPVLLMMLLLPQDLQAFNAMLHVHLSQARLTNHAGLPSAHLFGTPNTPSTHSIQHTQPLSLNTLPPHTPSQCTIPKHPTQQRQMPLSVKKENQPLSTSVSQVSVRKVDKEKQREHVVPSEPVARVHVREEELEGTVASVPQEGEGAMQRNESHSTL